VIAPLAVCLGVNVPQSADPELVIGVVLAGGVQVTVHATPRFSMSFVSVTLMAKVAPGARLESDPLGKEMAATMGMLEAPQPERRAAMMPNRSAKQANEAAAQFRRVPWFSPLDERRLYGPRRSALLDSPLGSLE
jgi:hypothetical protein